MRQTPAAVVFLAAAAAMLSTGRATSARGQAADDQTPPVFRAGADTVAVYTSVLDRYDDVVLDLTRGDFEILDDGKAQKLTVFQNGQQPITAVLLVDTSASMTLNLQQAQAAAEQFVIRMLPGDRARVGSFSDRVDLSAAFTGDRDALLRDMRDLHFGNSTKLWDAVEETMTDLAPVGGRRVIVLLTDGMDTVSSARETDVLERARGEEVLFYVAQFRSTLRANLAEVPLSPSPGSLFAGDPRLRNPPPTEALRRLADQTGGVHFLLRQNDDINATFTHIMEELHNQYVLGFTPQLHDGKLHTLEVRVRRPNVKVLGRKSYLAPPPSPGR